MACDVAEVEEVSTGDAVEVDHVASDVAEVDEVSTGDAAEVDHVACDVAEVEEVSTGDAVEVDHVASDVAEVDEVSTSAVAGVEATRAAGQAALSEVRLNPDGITSGGAVVILSEHWRILVEIAGGRTTIAADAPDLETAQELIAWGLVSATSDSRAPEPVPTS